MKKIVVIIWVALLTGCGHKPYADLVIYNAKIYTVDSSFAVVEAMAIKNGKVLDTGGNDIKEKYDSKEIIDAGGKCIYPGFIDAHCHFYGYSTDLTKCDLYGTTSFEEVLERLKNYNTTNQFSWILGRGWDQNDWEVKEFPDKTVLDSLFPDKPVYLMRIDGHAILVNQKCIDIAGINLQTTIPGGEIVKRNGKLTGLLIDNAVDAVKKFIPPFSNAIKASGLQTGQINCFAVGLTSVADAGLPFEDINLMDSLQKAGLLDMKVYAMAEYNAKNFSYWTNRGIYKSDKMHVSSFKIYSDGALGSRGACLLKPYSDQPGHFGFLLHDQEYLSTAVKKIYESGFQLNVHSIGDSANRIMLKLYSDVLMQKNDRRWRIEHCQVVNDQDLPYFGRYSIIPSVQPTHATSDMYWAGERLGDRIKSAYRYKDLMAQNGFIANGSDFPVEDINPLFGFYAAVSRKDKKNFPDQGFNKTNAITREEALKAMTIWAAYSCFEEKEKGSLESGKAADFVIMENDIMTLPEQAIHASPVITTYINGKKVYEKK